MKYLNKIVLLALVCMFPLFSCDTDELVELNLNPTAANELDWKFLFTQGQVQAAENRYVNGRCHLGITSHLIQHMASLESGERAMGDKYTRNEDSKNSYMWYVYRGGLKTLAEVIRQTGPEGTNPNWTNLHHMAQVMYIIPMHIMTDLYVNVPYSEANKGVDGIFFPVYDSQESIYKDMLNKLDAAASAIGSGPDQVGAADVIYGGDFGKWKKLANSLMLRLAMRISNVDPGTAQTFVQKAIAGGVMTSNDDMCFVPMSAGPSLWFNTNGLSRALIPDDWGGDSVMGKTLIDFLKSRNDPRLLIYSAGIGPWEGPFNTDYDAQQGLPNGYDTETIKEYEGTTDAVDPHATYSRLNVKLLDLDDPHMFLNYAEVEFLLAEAALKGWGDGDVEGHYNAGVKASMQQWTIYDESLTIDDATVDAYLSANPFDGTEQMIAEQHWAANFMNWYEAYSNWRRTAIPALVPNNYPGNLTGGQIFRRIQYYTNEVANNPNAASTGTQPDDFMTRGWWDVK